MKLVVFLLCFFSLSAYGQDYLITTRGDTLQGEIKPITYDRLERVQVKQKQDKQIFTAMQVMTFFYKGSFYRPIQYDHSIRFMKVLNSGYLSLLAFNPEGQNTMEGRLLKKLDGSALEVPNLNFKKIMAAFVSDCPEVKQKVSEGKLGRKDLNQIINEYNTCMTRATASTKQALATANESLQRVVPFQDLLKKVEALPEFNSRKDAVDLLHDMMDKVGRGQTIPNYQVDALKGFLAGQDSVKGELEKLLAGLKTP